MPAKRRGAKKKPSAGMSAAAAAAASASPDRKKLKSTRGGPDKPPSADISAKAQTFKELFCPGARIGVISMDVADGQSGGTQRAHRAYLHRALPAVPIPIPPL